MDEVIRRTVADPLLARPCWRTILRVENIGITLASLASVRAGLAEGFKLEDVLRAEGVDPALWPAADERWTEGLDDDPAGLLQEQYDAELARAQDRYGRRVPPLEDDLRAWLDFMRRWSADPAPMALLAHLDLRSTDVIRLQRSWTKRIAQDAALAAEANAILERDPGELPATRPEPSCIPVASGGAPPVALRETGKNTAAAAGDANVGHADVVATSGQTGTTVVFAPLPNEAEDSEEHAQSAEAARAPQPTASSAPTASAPRSAVPLAAAPAPTPSLVALSPAGPGAMPPLPASPSGALGATEEVPRDLLARVLQKGALPFSAAAARAPGSTEPAVMSPPVAPSSAASPGPHAGIGTTAELSPDLFQRIAKRSTPFVQSHGARTLGVRRPDEDSITHDAEPSSAGAAVPLPFIANRDQPTETTASTAMTGELPRDLVAQIARGPLPFRARRADPVDAREFGSTGPVPADVVAGLARGPLPFAAGAPRTSPSSQEPPPPQSLPKGAETASQRAPDGALSPAGDTLPFKKQKREEGGTVAMAAFAQVERELPFAAPTSSDASAPPPPASLVLTLEQHASLCAELTVFQGTTDAVFAKYGLSDIRQRLAADLAWRERLRKNADEQARWQRVHQHYVRFWTAQAPKRSGK